MNHFLAKGTVMEGKKLNYLLVNDRRNRIAKSVAYYINYEIEKILRDNYMDKDVVVSLNVRVIND